MNILPVPGWIANVYGLRSPLAQIERFARSPVANKFDSNNQAYLPDVAETMVRLATNSEGLGDFEVFHMQGQTLTGEALVDALGQAAGRRLPVHRLPWIAIKAMAPFNETMREMLEMRYLWDRPVLLDNSKLVARLGQEPRTPIVAALQAALAGMDALPRPALKLAA